MNTVASETRQGFKTTHSYHATWLNVYIVLCLGCLAVVIGLKDVYGSSHPEGQSIDPDKGYCVLSLRKIPSLRFLVHVRKVCRT